MSHMCTCIRHVTHHWWTEWGIVHRLSIEIEITITVFTAFSYLSYSNTTQAETPATITNPLAELRCVHRVKLGALHPESLSLVLWDSDCRGRLAWCRCWLRLRNCWFHYLGFGAAATHSYSTCWDDDVIDEGGAQVPLISWYFDQYTRKNWKYSAAKLLK